MIEHVKVIHFSAGTSVSAFLVSWCVQAVPVLQAIAALIAIISGLVSLAIVARRRREELAARARPPGNS